MSSYISEQVTGYTRASFAGRTLAIELTERCNNNCVHCSVNMPADCEQARVRELCTKKITGIISEAVSLGMLTVRFTGGEPLLRDDFTDIYLSARRMGMDVQLYTNATLITPRIADLFSKVPPLRPIEVTLYGINMRSYEAASRVPGSFEAAQNGIQLLQERNVPVYIKGALLPANVAELDKFEEWASTVSPYSPGYSMNFTLRSRLDDAAKNETIRKMRLSPEGTVMVERRHEDRYVALMTQFARKFMRPLGEKLFTCELGHNIDPYGILHPCAGLRCPDTGYDLQKGSLKDAIEKFQPKLSLLHAKNPAYLQRCARCFLRSLCSQCPAKSWAENGTLDSPVEYFCSVGHALAKFLGLIEDGEQGWEVSDWRERIARL